MKFRSTRPWDLVAVVAWALLAFVVVVADAPSLVRVPVGLVLVLFAPGYVFLAALYPERRVERRVLKGEDGEEDEEVSAGLSPLERVALSLALSIAIVPLLGIGLNFSPWGIRLVPIMVVLGVFVVGGAVWAWVRRGRLPEGRRFVVAFQVDWSWRAWRPLDRVLAVVLVLSVLAASGALVYVLSSPREGERFTEFYVLGSDGQAACYPGVWNGSYVSVEGCVGVLGNVTVGVVNHEGRLTDYWLRVVWTKEDRLADNTTVVRDLRVVAAWNVSLPHVKADLEPGSGFRSQYEVPVALGPPPFEGVQRWSVQLFDEAPPEAVATKGYMESPYRRVHLWVEAV